MKVLLTGGGTGGHITPLLSVAHELKSRSKTTSISYVGERHGKFAHLTDGNHDIDAVYSVFSGKFRRYHGQSWLVRLFDLKTNLQNLRDAILVSIGIVQAWLLLGRVKPDVIFLKGGYVGVPVGLAAAMRKVPFITHDSDAKAGLANRLVGRWAKAHVTALEPKHYKYDKQKIVHAGVIVSPFYKPVDENLQRSFKVS